jgi:hypothetical protein
MAAAAVAQDEDQSEVIVPRWFSGLEPTIHSCMLSSRRSQELCSRVLPTDFVIACKWILFCTLC